MLLVARLLTPPSIARGVRSLSTSLRGPSVHRHLKTSFRCDSKVGIYKEIIDSRGQ